MFGVDSEVDSGKLCDEQFPRNELSCRVEAGIVILTYVWC